MLSKSLQKVFDRLKRYKNPHSILKLEQDFLTEEDFRALSAALEEAKQSHTQTDIGEEDKHTQELVLALTQRNQLFSQHYQRLATLKAEEIAGFAAEIQPILQMLMTVEGIYAKPLAVDLIYITSEDQFFKLFNILMVADKDTKDTVAELFLLKVGLLSAFVDRLSTTKHSEKMVRFVMALASVPKFNKALRSDFEVKSTLYEMAVELQWIQGKAPFALEIFEFLRDLGEPNAAMRCVEITGDASKEHPGLEDKTIRQDTASALKQGAWKVFADFKPFTSKVREKPDPEIKFRADAKYNPDLTSSSFTQVAQQLQPAVNTIVDAKIENGVKGSPDLTEPFTAGLADETQARRILSDDTLRRTMQGYQISLLLGRVSDEKLIQAVISQEKNRLTKPELLRAARANIKLATIVLNGDIVKLDLDETQTLHLHHHLALPAFISSLKDKICSKKYSEITASELEYLVEKNPEQLATQVVDDLLSQWIKKEISETLLLAMMSYLLKNKNIGERVLKYLNSNPQLKTENTAQLLMVSIGQHHPHLIKNHLAELHDLHLHTLVWSHEDLAAFVLTSKQPDFELRILPMLYDIATRYSQLAIYILRNQKWSQYLTNRTIFQIGMYNAECADMILERSDLSAKLSDYDRIRLVADRHRLMTKMLVHQLTPYPYHKALNTSLAQVVLQDIKKADPEAIAALSASDPTFSYSVFRNLKNFKFWMQHISKPDLVLIACQNFTVAWMYFTFHALEKQFSTRQVAMILAAHPTFVLTQMQNKAAFDPILAVHPNLVYKLCCQNNRIAECILCNKNYFEFLNNFTPKEFVKICAKYPSTTLKFFSLASQDAFYKQYLSKLSPKDWQKLGKGIPDLMQLYPAYFAIQKAKENAAPPTAQLETKISPVPLPQNPLIPKRIVPRFQGDHLFDQRLLNTLAPDRVNEEGSCAGLVMDFIRYQTENEQDVNASYANILWEIAEGNMQHIDRVNYFQRQQTFILSNAEVQKKMFVSGNELTDAVLETIAQDTLALLDKKLSLFIESAEHVIGLKLHPKTGQIQLFEPNKGIWVFSGPCQDLTALLKDRLRRATRNVCLDLTISHIPIKSLQLDPCLNAMFPDTMPNRFKSAASNNPTIEAELAVHHREQRAKNKFFAEQEKAFAVLNSTNPRKDHTAIQHFTAAINSVRFVKPNEELWIKRIATATFHRGMAFFRLDKYAEASRDLLAAKSILQHEELALIEATLQQIQSCLHVEVVESNPGIRCSYRSLCINA